jgi:cytochrome c-type biogenesis protein
MDPSTTLAISGPLLVAALVAVAAGAVSFASPCVVPLVPGYLAYLAGLVGVDSRDTERTGTGRWRVAGAAALFVAGFTVVFGVILVGVVQVADALVANEAILQRAGGVVMIAMGLAVRRAHPGAAVREARALGAARRDLGRAAARRGVRPGLGAVHRADARRRRRRRGGTGGGSLRGVVLTLAYCAGLGLPFVLIALGASRAVRTLAWLRRHTRSIQIGGGVLMVAVGLALLTGLWVGCWPNCRPPSPASPRCSR